MLFRSPMPNLLSFTYYSQEHSYDEHRPGCMPSCKITTIRQAQVYGVLYYSSQLENLTLYITIDGLMDTRLLAAAISRMSDLQTILVHNLAFDCSKNKFIPTLVACCPPSLISLHVWHGMCDGFYETEDEKTEADWEAEKEAAKYFMPSLGEDDGVLIVPRQGHLDKLYQLDATQLNSLTEEEIRSVFKQCPNLTDIHTLELNEHIDPFDIAKYIGEHCPKVNRLIHRNRQHDVR